MSETKKKYIGISAFGILHFFTDLLCHYYAFNLVPKVWPYKTFELFLLYNFIAFALQCPIGYVVDRINSYIYKPVGVGCGVCFMGLGYMLGFGYGFVPVGLICCALGNAVIHTVGSRGVMEEGKTGLAGGGIFIAFGALGVGLGDYLGMNYNGKLIVRLLWVVTLITFFIVSAKIKSVHSVVPEVNERAGERGDLRCLALCLFAVFVRSFVGFILPNGFNELIAKGSEEASGAGSAVLKSLPGFAGKAMGGVIVVLLFGICKGKDLRKANYIYGTVALSVSTLLLFFFGNTVVGGLIGILLFHSVMPVTLYEIYCILPAYPGFSLGLTTLMLFAGMLPIVSFYIPGNVERMLLLILGLLGAAALMLALRIYLKDKKKEGRYA